MRISPYQAVNMLVAQSKGMLRLSDACFDQCFDALTELLEKANNQKGGAFTRHKDLEPQDVEYDAEGVARNATTIIPTE